MTRRNSDRINQREVARLYGTRPENVRTLTEAGDIPYHRTESRPDPKTGQDRIMYVYLRSMCQADIDERGRLNARQAVGA